MKCLNSNCSGILIKTVIETQKEFYLQEILVSEALNVPRDAKREEKLVHV